MAAALPLVQTERARVIFIKRPRPVPAKRNYCLKRTITNFPATGPPMGDFSPTSLTIRRQNLISGFCPCLEIKSHFSSCRLTPTKEQQGSHQTDAVSPTPQTN